MHEERTEPRVPCVGCNGEHGSVGAEFNCLRNSLTLERRMRLELEKRAHPAIENISELQRIKLEYDAIPVTIGGMFEAHAKAGRK